MKKGFALHLTGSSVSSISASMSNRRIITVTIIIVGGDVPKYLVTFIGKIKYNGKRNLDNV